MPKLYPTSISRTLDPAKKSLVTVVGQHDRQISDADVNLIQDLQDSKRQRLLESQTTSGVLSWSPFVFKNNISNIFILPTFDVLFNGEVVTIAGNNAPSIWKASTTFNLGSQITSGGFVYRVTTTGTTGLTLPTFNTTLGASTTDSSVVWINKGVYDPKSNNVFLPPPQFYTQGSTNKPAQIYVFYLEFWYAALNPVSGAGYFVDTLGQIGGVNQKYFFPYGCYYASLANMIPDDSIDPFQGLFTTERAQIQWAIRGQSIGLGYDFTKYRFGLDPGARTDEIVYGRGSSSTPVESSIYQFTNMGSINGDTGLWRSGDGNTNNSLNTMDGYSYAMPVAVCFQLNSGPFSVQSNIFGTSNPSSSIPNSGLLSSKDSGRFDSKFADIVYQDHVIDTRQTIALEGFDNSLLCSQGFADLVSGATQCAIGRGKSPGNSPLALGSKLEYYVSMSSTALLNTDTVGSFDGFSNGFSSDQRTYYTTKQITINQKNVGISGRPWIQNDAFSISLPAQSLATIDSAQVQILVSQTNGSNVPAFLLPGQISVSGLGTKTVFITLTANLTNTSFDPGTNPIFVTLGTKYPAGTGIDLKIVPTFVEGGQLIDGATGRTLPVFGVSEFAPFADQPVLTATKVTAINNKFSNTIFGTRIVVSVAGSTGVQSVVLGSTVTTFTLNRTQLDAGMDGLYIVSAADSVSGNAYTVISRSIKSSNAIVVVSGAVPPSSTVLITYLAHQTCQLLFNAPVKGITRIEETVLVGNYVSNLSLPMDNRITVVSNTYSSNNNVLVLASSDCVLKGLSGDDVNKLIWVQDTIDPILFTAVQIASASFQNGLVIINVPGPSNLTTQKFFFGAAILPAFSINTQLTVVENYIPYQGEGILNRNYEFLHTDDFGLVTTNGTGSAPIVGLQDVYPYNRELPICMTLPSLITWSDSSLVNGAVSSFFDSNYVAKKFQNVEHTFEVPLHTNDYIDPFNKDKRKVIQFISQGGSRGFNRATPHIGYAIVPVTPKTVLGNNLLATQAPITLYVNNVSGVDTNDGLTVTTAKLGVASALATLPPVLRHPCNIQLIDTGVPFLMSAIKTSLVVVALGDGTIITAKHYAVGNIAYTIQDSGRLVISAQTGSQNNVVIDATGYSGFGDGPTSAFFVDNTRVIFNKITFNNFVDPAVKGVASAIEYVNCNFTDNIQAGSYEQACIVTITGGALTLSDGGTGHVMVQSEMVVSGNNLVVRVNTNPGIFYVANRSSSLTLENHGTDTVSENNLVASTGIASASLNSSISCLGSFQSAGSASLTSNSVFQRTVSINPLLGGVTLDSSSSQTSNLN